MTVWARNDLASINISEAHGGCGRAHTRPAPGGIPDAVWKFNECPRCEDYLRRDPLWSSTAAEIPETHDEQKQREDFDRRGAKDKDAILTLALARLAGIGTAELPESLTRMISGTPAHIPGQLECPKGHAQPAGNPFCAQCGSPMSGPAPAAAIASAQKPAEATAAQGPLPRLRDQNKTVLRGLAHQRGIDENGTNGELVTRLSNAGVTNHDVAAYLDAASLAA